MEDKSAGRAEPYRGHRYYLKSRANGKRREYWLGVKAKVLTHYGKGELACVRCGFSDIRALSIDHIDGEGWAESRTGTALYTYLKRLGYPEGYQTLCMNCQFIKREENYEYRMG